MGFNSGFKGLIDRMCSYDCPEPSYYFYVTAPADIIGFCPYPPDRTLYLTTRCNSLVRYNPNGFILYHFLFLYLHPIPCSSM